VGEGGPKGAQRKPVQLNDGWHDHRYGGRVALLMELSGHRPHPLPPCCLPAGPSKRGGYGFIKTTLSERQGHKGVAGEYEYLSDPIDFKKVRAARPRLSHVTANDSNDTACWNH
jgi:hypothetical protein